MLNTGINFLTVTYLYTIPVKTLNNFSLCKLLLNTSEKKIFQLANTGNNFRVLERLERFTGAKIISSIDSMLKAPTLGSCGSFYVESSGIGLER